MAFGNKTVGPVLPAGALSLATAVQQFSLGQRISEGGIDYIYCYNGGAASITQGKGAFVSPANYSCQMTVAVSNAASQSGMDRFVGVAHNVAIPASEYGFVATRGPVLIALDASEVSMASADRIVPGVDGGFVKRAESVDTAVTAALGEIGHCLNSCVTTVGTGKAYIKSPLYG